MLNIAARPLPCQRPSSVLASPVVAIFIDCRCYLHRLPLLYSSRPRECTPTFHPKEPAISPNQPANFQNQPLPLRPQPLLTPSMFRYLEI